MIPAAFDYVRAHSIDAAAAALAEHGDEAKLLAGGMSLLPLMKLRLAVPSVLVDVGRLDDLRYVRDAGDHLAVGALSRHRDLETDALLAAHCGVLRAVAAEVGDNQVRHRGTIGGSAAHGDPASDLPAVLLALDAQLVARGPGGERTIAAADFFAGFLETALAPDELLTEIRVPKTGPDDFAYEKFNRRAQDWAIVGSLAVRARGTTRVALVNMGPTPIRAGAVEAALAAGASPADAATVAPEGTEPSADINATVAYREHLARVLTRQRVGGDHLTVAVGILAAGRGRRFGAAKQLAELDGRPLVRWAVDAAMASGLRPVGVVVGPTASRVELVLPQGVDVIRAPGARKGIAHTLRALVRALEGWRQVDAVCVGLADQPLVGSDAYRRLVGAYDAGATLAVATYGGERQNPVLLARELWPRIRKLSGDVGARALMDEVPVAEVDCTDTGRPDDVDTVEDLNRLAREMER